MTTIRQERMSEYSLLDERLSDKISFEGFLYGLEHPEISWEQISQSCVFKIPYLDNQGGLLEQVSNKRHFNMEEDKYGNNYSGDYNIYSDYADNCDQVVTSRLEKYLSRRSPCDSNGSDSEDSLDSLDSNRNGSDE